MNEQDRTAYLKHISGTYDARSAGHDASTWHRDTALRLVDGMPPRPGDAVLDVGTGTGTIAFHAASLVGNSGRVIGVDISGGMLAQAQAKLATLGLDNTAFVQADAERLGFPPCSFDRIYCASAFFCVLDPEQTLKHWFRLLKPGGTIGFHALPETSFIWVSLAREVLREYGISYVLNTPTASRDICESLLANAGFTSIDIREEAQGYYITLEGAKQGWVEPDSFVPGQYPNPVSGVATDIVEKARGDYEAKLQALVTDQGIWNDVSMFYVYASREGT